MLKCLNFLFRYIIQDSNKKSEFWNDHLKKNVYIEGKNSKKCFVVTFWFWNPILDWYFDRLKNSEKEYKTRVRTQPIQKISNLLKRMKIGIKLVFLIKNMYFFCLIFSNYNKVVFFNEKSRTKNTSFHEICLLKNGLSKM